MVNGIVFNIQRYSVQDGPGIRTTVFLKGCPLDCWWCHNPESQSAGPQVMFNPGRCIRCGACRDACPHGMEGVCGQCGACAQACPTGARQMAGREMTAGEVIEQILKDRIFFDDSGGGATFSGGEPLMQFEFLRAMLAACRDEGVHTAMDTCGHARREELLAAASLCDLVLYDLKVIDEARHIQYTGVSNRRILENLKALCGAHRNIWIRIPVVPGINDGESDVEDLARVISGLEGVQRITLLPYHKSGAAKFERIGRPYRLADIDAPSSERMARIAEHFERLGLRNLTVG